MTNDVKAFQWRMTTSDVARLAGVKRAVVSRWRSRFPSDCDTPFPAPIAREGTTTYFDPYDVVDWLVSTAHGNNPDPAADLAPHMRAFPAISPDALLALLALRDDLGQDLGAHDADDLLDRADEADPDDAWLYSEVESLGDDLPRAVRLIDAIAGASSSLEQAFRAVVRQHTPAEMRDILSEDAVDLVVELGLAVSPWADDTNDVRLVDQTGRSSDIMARLAARTPESATVSISSPSTGSESVRALRRRMSLAGVPFASIDAGEVGDFSVDGDALIISQHPVAADAEPLDVLDAVENIVGQMTGAQRAIVIAPASVLVDPLRTARARASRRQLIDDGRLRAVVQLPAGGVPAHPRQRLAVWVLGESSGMTAVGERRVFVASCDVQAFDEAARESLVGDIVAAWGDPRLAHERVFTSGITVAESTLRTATGSLVAEATAAARAGVTSAADTGEGRHARVRDLEAAIIAPLPELVSDVFTTSEPYAPLASSLGELAKDGHLSVRPGARIAPGDIGPTGFVVVGADELAGVVPAETRRIEHSTLIAHNPNVDVTEPGDVIFVESPRPRAWVDIEGASVVMAPARIVRLNANDSNAAVPELIAMAINAQPSHARGWRTWMVRRLRYTPADPELLSADDSELSERELRLRMRNREIDGYRAVHARVDVARQALRERLAQLDELDELLADGLSAGILTTLPPEAKPRPVRKKKEPHDGTA